MEIGRSSEYDRSLARAKVDPLLAAGGAAAHENGQLWSNHRCRLVVDIYVVRDLDEGEDMSARSLQGLRQRHGFLTLMMVSTKVILPMRYNTLNVPWKVNMLLFIAPVSAFNQTLVEDRSVNRLVRVVCLLS